MRFLISILSTFLFLSTSCTDKYPLDAEHESQIFLSGFVLNKTDHVTNHIQEIVPVQQRSEKPINDANVSIYIRDKSGFDVFRPKCS